MVQHQRRLISLICPVFNEEEATPLFYERLMKALAPLRHNYDFQILFTNNRSTDRTLEVLRGLRELDHSVEVLTLSRNFGYQASLQAGMSYACGEAVIAIDVDCEDPPELIELFVRKWEEGYDVVYGIRYDREEWLPIKKLRHLFYWVLRATADMEIVLYMAEFALIGSAVRNAIINNNNTYPFLRSEIGYVGFARCGIKYKRQARVAGHTHYSFGRMFSFALAGILTSSTILMRIAGYFWPLLAVISLFALGFDYFKKSSAGFEVAVVVLLLYISFFLMIFGLYIARIYKNGMGRPVFLVDFKQSFLNGQFPGMDLSRAQRVGSSSTL